MNRKVQLGKAYRFLFKSYIAMMAVALCISVFGYVYSYWTIRQDIDLNYSALLNQEKLTYDKEWNRIVSNISVVSSDSTVKRLANLDEWQVEDLFDVVDLISEIKATLRNNNSIDSIGVYFYKNESFVTNEDRYAKQINYLFLLDYDISVEEFTSGMIGGSGYYILTKGNERYLVFYQNIFDNSYKKVIASSFAILPWSYLNHEINSIYISKGSGSYLVNSDGILIGNSNDKVRISINEDDYIKTDHELFDMNIDGKEYILSSIASEVLDIRYVIYAPKLVFFKNINLLGYIILIEIVCCILVGGLLAVYFSNKNSMPIERLLSLLKVQRSETEDASFTQIYQSLENSLQSLVVGHEHLFHKLNNIDLVVEKYVFTNLMRGWNPDDGWMEEYLVRIKQKYPISNYRIVLFTYNNLDKSLFAKEHETGNKSIDFPLMIFSLENVINELVLKFDYNNFDAKPEVKGIIIQMGDMTACIVNSSIEVENDVLQESVQHCINFFQSAFKIKSYASISGLHMGYETLDIAYEEALMTITHKSFWGNSLSDVVLYDNEKAEYNESNKENKLMLQAKKITNCLMMMDYEKASNYLDETMEICFSKDISKLSYNQYQAATLICIILGNMSELNNMNETMISSNDWTSSDRILSMSSLKDIQLNLHSIIDEIAQRYEETSCKTDEPEWLLKAEEYAKAHYSDPEINISAIADKFRISLSHMGRTYKKYRGINMLDYIHHLRIQKCKELMDKGFSVNDCAKEVGYIDAKSFIRAFKRYEGITPGQYKAVKLK